MHRTILFCTLLLTVSIMTKGQAQQEPTPGQTHMKELAFIVGEWEVTDKDGKTKDMSIKWINNKSYISLIAEDYREIIGWDLTKKQFVTWAFGTHGGQAKMYWVKDGASAWKIEAQPAFIVSSGKHLAWLATLTSVDKDTMTLVGVFGDGEFNNTAKRKHPDPAR